jgi:surface antigen
MGNIEQESSFNPTIVEGGNGIGLGIIQWSFGRRTSLEAAANAAGVDLTDSSPENNDAALLFELNWLWDGEYKGMTWQEPTNAESTVDGDASVSFSADNTGNGSAMVFHSLVERSGDGTDGKQERIDGAKSFLEKFGAAGSVSGECSIGEGGLTLEQTSKIMEFYRDKEDDATLMDYTSLAGTCSGQGAPANRDPAVMGRIANCTSFSSYFINKFTDFKDAAGNGNEKVGLLYQNNPGADGDQTSHTPQLFAVFSRQSGASGAGHTGVIFGIHGDTVVIGEASCNAGYPGIVAREMTLAEMSSDDYTYFYTGSHVKQDVIQEVMNG